MSFPPDPHVSADDTPPDRPALRRRLARRAGVIAAAALLCGAIGYGLASAVPQRFAADTQIVISPPAGAAAPATLIDEQIQLIASPDLARRVAGRLRLETLAEFSGTGRSLFEDLLVLVGVREDPGRDSPEERTVKRLLAGLSVAPAGRSALVVGFTSQDRERAADVANTVVAEYRALLAAATASGAPRAAVRVVSTARPPEAPVFPHPLRWSLLAALAGAMLAAGGLAVAGLARGAGGSEGEDLPEVSALGLPADIAAGGAAPSSAARRAERFRRRVGQLLEEAPAAVSAAPSAFACDFLTASGLHALLLADGTARVAFIGLSDAVAGRRAIDSLSLTATEDGERVVVIETDPEVDGFRGPGVSDLILGKAGFGEIIRRNPMTRAHEIGVGRQPLGAAVEEEDALRTMLDALEHTYDLVLMDLGLMRADKVLIAFIGLAERIVLVGEADNGNVRIARDILARHGFTNVVLARGICQEGVGAVA